MSGPLPVGDLEGVRNRLADTTLGDVRLPARLCELPLSGDKVLPLPAGFTAGAGAKLKLLLEGRAAVFLFNGPEDRDPDGVVSARAALAEDPPPLLVAGGGQAWLKYTSAARVRSNGGLEALGFAFDLGGAVALGDYRRHPSDRPLAAAVIEDLRAPARFAFRLDDVRALGPGEALSMRLGGAVELSVELAAADALAAGAGALAQLLEGAGCDPPLGFRIEAGARLRARIHAEDQFLLVFARDRDGAPDTGGFRIVLRKTAFKHRAAAVGLGVRVLLDPLDVSALADRVLAALPRPPVAAQLPLLRQQLEQRIEQVAASRLGAGFGFEYGRLEEQSDLLAIRASEPWLGRHHGDLIRGRLQPVLDSIRLGAEGVTLERFLDRRALRTERSWGLSLGLGDWAISGQDRRRTARVTRTLADGRQARTLGAVTGYDGQLGGSRVSWSASLQADTLGFAAGPVPRVAEYRFGLALTWTCAEQRLGVDELRQLLDAAVVWNAVGEDHVRPLADQLRPLLGREVQAVIQLVLDDEVLRAIMRRAATAPLSAMAGALAAAMPDWDLSADRHSAYRRRELYSKLWAQYLADPQPAPERWAIEAEHLLGREFEAAALARLERQYQIARPYSFAGLIELNGGPATADACRRFHQALGALGQAIETGAPDDDLVARALGELGKLFTQSHHARAAGVYLLDGARAAGLIRRPWRSLSVTSPGEPDLIVGR